MHGQSRQRVCSARSRAIAFAFLTVCGAAWAQPAFVPFQAHLYPHRVEFIVNDGPLLRAIVPNGVNGGMGWANKLGVGQVPPGAAGAVLYQEPHAAVMLSWEHPIYDPVNQSYRFNFAAASNVSPMRSTPPARIGGIRRNIRNPPLTRPDGSVGAGVQGRAFQATGLIQIKTRESSFRAFPPGPAIEIWASAGTGSGGCKNWLATYNVWAN